MRKRKFSKYTRPLILGAKKHTPGILMGIGIVGMGITVVLTVDATPKALRIIEEEKMLAAECEEDFTNADMVKAAWKCYIPPAVAFALSTCCLVGSHSVSTRRYAALTAAYALTESDFLKYQEKVSHVLGIKQDREVRDAIAQEKMDENPIKSKEVVIIDNGKTLFFEPLTSRYFMSDVEAVKKAVNELNRTMLEENYVSENDYFYALGLDSVQHGDEIGWNVYKGYIDLDIGAHVSKEGKPCLYLGHFRPPVWDYRY